MKFTGVKVTFSTTNNEQFEAIGDFWRVMRELHPQSSYMGLGHNWRGNHFDYAIGERMTAREVTSATFDMNEVKKYFPTAEIVTVDIPDKDWEAHWSSIENLSVAYGEIWSAGTIDFEIEEFNRGQVRILVHRVDS